MQTSDTSHKPQALTLLSSERPRNIGWLSAAGFLFGDWGTSRLYVLGLALFYAGRTSFWLIVAMSLLIFAVGWAYSQICRIYPDGGGVYTAAKQTSRTLAVVGALLLFADYTVTASLSVVDAFHYFGLPLKHHVHHDEGRTVNRTVKEPVAIATKTFNPKDRDIDAGNFLDTERVKKDEVPETDKKEVKPGAVNASEPKSNEADQKETVPPPPAGGIRGTLAVFWNHFLGLLAWDSPGLWAIVAIALIGLFNMMGPGHTASFAIVAALGMVFITLLILAFAIPQMHLANLPKRLSPDFSHPGELWVAFVSIVLALSGVEAIANLTGVMRRPVAATVRKAIWVVATEVAVFNILLAICMLAIFPINRDAHMEDMAAHLSFEYVGKWGEWAVRVIGGLLLLSAGNTAIAGMISIQYLMARDSELPAPLVRLNRFGVPWMAAVIATAVPIGVLLISHDVDQLAALYAIGVIGAVAINISLCAFHPRLRKYRRKIPMIMLGLVLISIWVTLAYVKREALLFVTVVMVVGLCARQLNKWLSSRKGPRPSLLRQAIMQQLGQGAMDRSRILVGTYGSESLARPALVEAQSRNATLVVCFIRSVRLSRDWGNQLSMDTDLAALKVFAKFLELGHQMGVPVLPVYDSGNDAVELMAEAAAITGSEVILLGTSRQGAFYQLIKGNFQKRLEELLPPEIGVKVIVPETAGAGSEAGNHTAGKSEGTPIKEEAAPVALPSSKPED